MERLTGEEIRIMSFNIKCKSARDGQNGWEFRKGKTISMIAFHRPLIAGLQEVFKEQLTDLADALPKSYSWIGVGREDGQEKGEYCPVFYRHDLFKPVLYETKWLSETPELCGSFGWDSAFPRVVTRIHFQVMQTGNVFAVLNTHLDHKGPEAKKNGANQVKQLAVHDTAQMPVIVTGDFNSLRDEIAYRIMTSQENGQPILRDAEYVSETGHHGPTTSAHDFWGRDNLSRIDYIFVSNRVRVTDHAILADHWDGWYPSDHMPVVADIVL